MLIVGFSVGGAIVNNTFFPFNLNVWDSQIQIFLASAGILYFNEQVSKSLINKKKYLNEPEKFIDRTSHIKEIVHLIKTNKNLVINVYGVSGIGVTRLFHFIADLVNKRLSIFKRLNYISIKDDISLNKFICIYVDVSKVVNYSSLLQIIYDENFIDKNSQSENISSAFLIDLLNKKTRLKKMIFLFDGVSHDQQLTLVEDFIRDFYRIKSKAHFLIGSKNKKTTFEVPCENVEIMKFNKEELMVLAKVHKTKLKFNDGVKIYEMTDGIPLYAYLVIKNYKVNQEIIDSELVTYLENKIIAKINDIEFELLGKISLLSLAQNPIEIRLLEKLYGKVDLKILDSLSLKALIRYDKNSKKVSMTDYVAKIVIPQVVKKESLLSDINLLSNYYKQKVKPEFSIMYLLLLKTITIEQESYFNKSLDKLIFDQEVLSIIHALSPAIDYQINIKKNLPNLYLSYCHAATFMLLSCGKYPDAEYFMGQLEIDGHLIKRYDQLETDRDFNFNFLWADLEHLLNHYSKSIYIIEQLIDQATRLEEYHRLPQFYWLKAHCQRHMWKNEKDSVINYKECERLSIQWNNEEYLIRSIHGQILAAFIREDPDFDFKQQFLRLKKIYNRTPNTWQQYFYNTLKYRGIYEREHGEYDKATNLLKDALKQFKKIKRRNAYDIKFELAENYRKKIQVISDEEEQRKLYKKSQEYYEKVIVFSTENNDDNLNSLAQMGLILLNIKNESYDTNELISKLLGIQCKCTEKDLYLNSAYAKKITKYLYLDGFGQIDELISLSLFNP